MTDEYKPLAEFTGRIVQVDVDLHPDFTYDPDRHSSAQLTHALVRQ